MAARHKGSKHKPKPCKYPDGPAQPKKIWGSEQVTIQGLVQIRNEPEPEHSAWSIPKERVIKAKQRTYTAQWEEGDSRGQGAGPVGEDP